MDLPFIKGSCKFIERFPFLFFPLLFFFFLSHGFPFALQFNRGTSAMQHYVATRPMFIDVEVMNADSRLVLGDQGSQASPSNVARGLSSMFKEITGLENSHLSQARVAFFRGLLKIYASLLQTLSVKKQLQLWQYSHLLMMSCPFWFRYLGRNVFIILHMFYIILFKLQTAFRFLCEFIFMMFSMYVQRVLEQRVTALLDKLLVKPSLVNLPPMEEGGLLLVCRIAWSTVSRSCVSV
jgi:hypothetical protein